MKAPRNRRVFVIGYGAATPLSNFEANMDYRDVEDPSLTVRLEVLEGTRTRIDIAEILHRVTTIAGALRTFQ